MLYETAWGMARSALLFSWERGNGCSANTHTIPTYCCKTNWHRLIKIPLPTALEQTAKLGRTMNIINTMDFPTWLASPYSANYRHRGHFNEWPQNALIRAHYIKFFNHLASMTANFQFPELVQTSGRMHTNFQTITLSQMSEKSRTITLHVWSSWGFRPPIRPTHWVLRGWHLGFLRNYVDERLSSKLWPPQQRDRPIRKVSLQEILMYRHISANRKLNLQL